MRRPITLTRSSAVLLALTLAPLCDVSAATFSGSIGPGFTTTTNYDLDALGTVDWTYWDTTGSGAGLVTNSKSGADIIGDIGNLGGSGVRSSDSNTTPYATYDFTGGTGPASATGELASGVFNASLGFNNPGVGVGLTIDLPDVRDYTVYVWAFGFDTNEGTFTASLSDFATDYTQTIVEDGSLKETYLITLNVTPDAAGDDLTLSIVNTDPETSFSHVGFSGVAVYAVPEPAAAGLLASCAALLCVAARRRRR
jgi:hypothetical protein